MKNQILRLLFLSTLLTGPVFAGYDDPWTEGINEGAIGKYDYPWTDEINEGAIS